MPHAFVPRPRLMNVVERRADLRADFWWESFNAFAYKLGGVLFVIGSVLFFPALSAWANLGAWIFFAGSILYLIVTGHDLLEARRHARGGPGGRATTERLQLIAAWTYVAGTLLFMVGSIFFLSWVGWERAGAWCFILGSLLFVAGAVVNVLESFDAGAPTQLRLMNLTGLCYVVGSVLFVVASVPYLWDVRGEAAERVLHAFLAWQYLIGSLLFLLGGVLNYRRAWLLVREAMRSG